MKPETLVKTKKQGCICHISNASVDRLNNLRPIKENPLDMGQPSFWCTFDWKGSEFQPIIEGLVKLHTRAEKYIPDMGKIDVQIGVEYIPLPYGSNDPEHVFYNYRLFLNIPESGVKESSHETYQFLNVTLTEDEARIMKLFLADAVETEMYRFLRSDKEAC